MVIKVKNANYAAKAVRVIDIPVEPEAETVAYAEHIPTSYAAMSDTKKKALNKAIRDLKNNGLWSKIDHLYLPILGRSEGGVNLKNPTFNIGFPAAGAVVTYDSHGALFLQGWNSGLTVNAASFHVAFYNTTSNASDTATRVGLSISNGGMWLAARRGGLNGTGMFMDGAYQAKIANHVSGVGPIISSYVSATKFIGCAIDAEYVQATRTEANPVITSTALWVGATALGASTNALASPMGLIAVGAGLNQTESTLYGAIQTTLLTALAAA